MKDQYSKLRLAKLIPLLPKEIWDQIDRSIKYVGNSTRQPDESESTYWERKAKAIACRHFLRGMAVAEAINKAIHDLDHPWGVDPAVWAWM
jgi:hypothetical protein